MSSATEPSSPDHPISLLVEQAGGLPAATDNTRLQRVGLVGSPGEIASLADDITTAGLQAIPVSTSQSPAALGPAIDDLRGCELVLQVDGECHKARSAIETALDALAAGATALAGPACTGTATRRFGKQPTASAWAACRVSARHGQHRLLEIKTHAHTAAQTVAALSALGQRCGWPLVQTPDVAAGPGWRIESALLYEAMAMVGDAIDPTHIEQSAQALGIHTPPLMRLDQVGLDLVDHLLHAELHALAHEHEHEHDHDHKHHDHGHDHAGHHHDHSHDHSHAHGVQSKVMSESAVYVMEKMAHGFNRMGLAAGAGFYDYDYDDEPPELWEGLSAFGRGADKADPADCKDRLLIASAVQTLHCLEANLLSSPAEANLVAVLGSGFPAELAGPVAWIKSMGTDQFVTRANDLGHRYGDRFIPPANTADLLA
jgi:3-hydroxyacyl-CoA dehydrogenase/enoyl-CoA hydratase/3-hydroxybutyryl-CoA epimerase